MRLRFTIRDLLSMGLLPVAAAVMLLLDPRVRRSLALVGSGMIIYAAATWVAIAIFIKATQWQRKKGALEFWQLTKWQLAILLFLLAILYGITSAYQLI